MHSRRRLICWPSATSLESTTLVSWVPQNGQCMRASAKERFPERGERAKAPNKKGRPQPPCHSTGLLVNREAGTDLLDLSLYARKGRIVADIVEDIADPTGQLRHFLFLEAATGHGRSTDTQTGGNERRTRVVRYGVLVHGNVGAAQGSVRILTGDILVDQINQEQVVFSTAGDDVDATLDKYFGHRLGVFNDLSLILFPLRLHRFLEANRLGSDHVHQRAALRFREHREVQLLLQLFISIGRQDQATTRTTQGLVSGGSHHVCEGQRRRVYTGSHKTGDVRHVDEQVSTYLVGDFAETRPVNDLRVGRETGHDHLRLVLNRQTFDFFVVDGAGFSVQAVLYGLVDTTGEGYGSAMGQVTTVSQTHTQNSVARLAQRHKYGGVSL